MHDTQILKLLSEGVLKGISLGIALPGEDLRFSGCAVLSVPFYSTSLPFQLKERHFSSLFELSETRMRCVIILHDDEVRRFMITCAINYTYTLTLIAIGFMITEHIRSGGDKGKIVCAM